MSEDALIDRAEAEYRLLYSVVVAGKSAEFARNAMTQFLAGDMERVSPYAYLSTLVANGTLEPTIRTARMGTYRKLTLSFAAIEQRKPDMFSVSPIELEQIHGIGPKTARFAIMWVRPNERYAALDTHVLKWLKFIGHDAPKATPHGEKYAALEVIMLAEADRRGLKPRLLDALIWDYCAYHREHLVRGQWPSYLQATPQPVPRHVLASFKEVAA